MYRVRAPPRVRAHDVCIVLSSYSYNDTSALTHTATRVRGQAPRTVSGQDTRTGKVRCRLIHACAAKCGQLTLYTP